MEKKVWSSASHERKVENFYSSGLSEYHNYHGGYLSFGYWTHPNITYLEAAENLVQTLGKKLGLNNQSILLDIGSGLGAQDIYLVKNFNPQKIDALDVTRKHIEISIKRAERAGIGSNKLEYHHGTATEIPFENNKFTHILSIEAPEHIKTRENFLVEAYRVLKTGGVIVMSDYVLPQMPKNIFKKLFLEIVRKIWQVPRENVYGADTYYSILKKIGFKNITIENVGKNVIPGYYYEHRRPESVHEIKRIRGFWRGVVGGFLIDFGVYWAYNLKLCEYVFVRAEK